MALGLQEWNPAGRQISCLSRYSLFCVSWAHRYFFSKIFLELTSAVNVYMKGGFKFLLWPVDRPHLVPSQDVLLCDNGNIWEFYHTDTELRIVFHPLLGDSLLYSFLSLCLSLGSAVWGPPVQSCWFYWHWVVLIWCSALAPQLWVRRKMTARATLPWAAMGAPPRASPLSLPFPCACSCSAFHCQHDTKGNRNPAWSGAHLDVWKDGYLNPRTPECTCLLPKHKIFYLVVSSQHTWRYTFIKCQSLTIVEQPSHKDSLKFSSSLLKLFCL